MLLPIRDEKNSFLIDTNNIMCVRTNKIHDMALSQVKQEDFYISTIEVICSNDPRMSDINITLKYRIKEVRDRVFNDIYKVLKHETTSAIVRDIDFKDDCIGGAL